VQGIGVARPASQQILVAAKGIAQQPLFMQFLSALEGAGGVDHGAAGLSVVRIIYIMLSSTTDLTPP
jgi:hypothetical protein